MKLSFKTMGLKSKLMIMLGIVIIIGSSVVTSFAAFRMKIATERQLENFVVTTFKAGKELMEEKNPGFWNIEQGKLLKGMQPINDNHFFIDNLVPRLGNEDIRMSVSQGETLVATNIKVGDQYAVGETIADDVRKTTLEKGETYKGYTKVSGVRYYAVYDPIKTEAGESIGVLSFLVPTSETDKQISDFILWLVVIAIGILVSSLAMAFFFTHQLTRLLKKVGVMSNRIADGDLLVEPVKIISHDEVGMVSESINRMIDNLRGIVGKVDAAVGQVGQSSNNLAESAEQAKAVTNEIAETMSMLAASSDGQVRTSEESSLAVAAMAEDIQNAAASSALVFQESKHMTEQAVRGIESIEAAVSQMTVVNDTVNKTSDSIEHLNHMSVQIEQIAAVIEGIASQTNLLALNAAIEAARAGESGRGFAVVADEIRKLSYQTEQSAKQIAGLVTKVLTAANDADVSMQRGKKEFTEGFERVDRASAVFRLIADSASSITGKMEEMSAFSERMSASTEEVAASVEEISGSARQAAIGVHGAAAMTEEESATMEEVAHAAAVLRELAEDLKQAISQFKL
ncbi:methyl-accepting chemotaxis protein [Gorillibacterium timonense]|uniref:methyl-accepting chemotaxis protein n=1 Tax=Gorillibacterium timonense TaxID=1689269 RepID=UPI00071E49EF|nr:methyl-accepting chemotaxis protein [Gorillibacterium timonense]